MIRVQRRVGATYRDCFLVLFEAEECHVARNRRIYRQKGIAGAESLRLLQRFQSALRLPAAGIGISQPCITEGKVRIQFEGFGEMHHRRFRTTTTSVTEYHHEKAPMVLLVARLTA